MASWPAHTGYQMEMGYGEPEALRVGALHMQRLIRPGTLVRTSYNSGPYVVVSANRDWLWLRGRDYEYW